MSKLKWIGIGVAVLAVGGVASRALGSTPEAPTGGPLALCGPDPNCARVRVAVEASPEAVREAAREALAEIDAVGIRETDTGWEAATPVGPFTDDLRLAIEPDGDGSVLWVRSASRVGKSDLGVNARRARRVAEAVQRLARA